MTPPLYYPPGAIEEGAPAGHNTPPNNDSGTLVTTEQLHSGDLVNVYTDAGQPRVRRASAAAVGKEAHGYVLTSATVGEGVTVYFEGTNTQVTALTPGPQYLSATSGLCSSSAPSSSGNVVQRVGVALSATELNFEGGPIAVLA